MKKLFINQKIYFLCSIIIVLSFCRDVFSIKQKTNGLNADCCLADFDINTCCTSNDNTTCCTDNSKIITPRTIIKFFSQGARLYSQYHKILNEDEDRLHNITIESALSYDSLFPDQSVMPLFFGSNSIGFQGTMNVQGDGSRSTEKLVAGYFGFNDDANFTFCIEKSLYKNIICDTKIAMQSDSWWMHMNIPFVYNKQCISRGEGINYEGTLGFSSPDSAATAVIQTPATKDGTDVYSKLDLDGTFSEFPTGPNSQEIYDYLIDIAQLDSYIDSSLSEQLANVTIPLNFWGTTNFSITEVDSDTHLPIKKVSSNVTNQYQFVFTENGTNENFAIAINQINGANTIEQGLGGYTFGDLKERLYNKVIFDPCNSKVNTLGVADLHIQCGKDVCSKKNYGLSIFGQFVLPTGTKIDRNWNAYTFAPLIGNGGHCEVGGGFTAFLRGETGCNKLQLDLAGYITHPFSNKQFRSFDYDDAPLSRWALLKELYKGNTYNASNDDDVYTYTHNTRALGDVNAYDCIISCDIISELMCDITFTRNSFAIGLGYSLGYRSEEKITLASAECCNKENDFQYGYKGATNNDAMRFLMLPLTPDTDPDESKIINYLENGQQVESGPEGSDIQIKVLSDIVKGGKSGAFSYGTEFSSTSNPIEQSDLLQFPSLNCSGYAPQITTHRFFMHSDYCAIDITNQPFIGINGAIILHDLCGLSLTSWEIGMRMGIMF